MSFEPDERCSTYLPIGCHVYINDSWPSPFKGTISHHINHSYQADFFGFSVPLLVTKRNFSANWNHVVGPRTPSDSLWDGYSNFVIVCSDANPRDTFEQNITEDCVIEKSTLCYVDHRSSVLLYRYEKQWVKFNKSSTDQCWWRTEYDAIGTGKITLKKGDVDAGRQLEWRLIVDGKQSAVHTETDTSLAPFGEGYSAMRRDGTMTDPDIVQIFSLPQPPSKVTPYDEDIYALMGRNNGLYDYGNELGEESLLNMEDGGGKDMFYPKWCRNLHSDPIWREVADNRYMISWFHAETVQDKVWLPPTLASDPLPRGNHAYSPALGDVWQWVLPRFDGSSVVKTNADFVDGLLTTAGVSLTGTNLYYPFGVV